MTTFSKKMLAALLGLSQALTPLLASAAQYEYARAVPQLKVTAPPPAPADGGGSTGTGAGAGGTTPPAATAVLSASASSLQFDSVDIGQSKTQTVLVSNTGTAAFTFSAPLSVSGAGYSASSNCGSTLAAGQSCQVSVTFAPQAGGAAVGSLSVAGNASNAPLSVALSGSGLVRFASSRWAATSIDFGGVLLGSTATRSTTLYNEGNQTADYSHLSSLPSGVTADASACASVAGGGSCVVSFIYAPTVAGTYAASNVVPTVGQHSNTLALAGQGLTTAVELSTHSLSFGNQALNTTSTEKSVLVLNTGTAPLSLGSLTVSGQFTASTDCGSSLAAGASCNVNVTFSPTTASAVSGSVSLNTGTGTQTVSLSGYGAVAMTTALSVSWTEVIAPSGQFPTTLLGSSSRLATFVVPAGNVGTLSIGASLSGSGDFKIVSAQKVHTYYVGTALTYESLSCGAAVSATSVSSCVADANGSNSAQLAVTVQFTPSSVGTKTAALSISHNGTNASPLILSLTGTGQGVATADLSAATLDFGSTVLVGAASTQTVRLTNNGTAALALNTAPTLTGSAAFSFPASSTTCGSSLAVGSYCDTSVQFTPTSTALVTGTVSFSTSVGTVSVAVRGTGLSTDFTGATFVNSGYAWVYRSGSVTYPNALTLCAGNINGTSDWLVPSKAMLGAVRASLGTSGLTAKGWPMGAATWYWTTDAYTGTTQYVLNDSTQSYAGRTDGTVENLACARPVAAGSLTSPTSGSFGNVLAGSTATQTFTLTNTGVLALSGVTWSVQGTGVSISNNTCASSLASGASCSATVSWASALGSLSGASVSVASNAANGTQTVNLSGTGMTQANLFKYGTWDTNFGSTTATLSNGNLSAYITASVSNSTGSVRNSVDMTTGQYYWEVKVVDWASTYGPGLGITPVSSTVQNVSSSIGYFYWTNLSTVTYNATNILSSFGSGFAGGDTAGFLYDGDAHTLTVSRNGVANGTITGIPAGTWRVAARSSGSQYSSNITANFGATAFLYGAKATGAVTADASADFGSVAVGLTSSRTFTYKNTGVLTASGVTPSVTGSGLSVASTTCGATVAPGATCSITVQYAPSATNTLSGASVSVASSTTGGSASLTVTGSGYLPNTVLLLHMDGTIADSMGHTWDQKANLAYNTATPLSGQSLVFNGTSSTLSYNGTTDFTFGTGDFTLEAWVKPTNYTYNGTYGRAIIDFRPDATNGVYPVVVLNKTSGVFDIVISGTTVASGNTAVPLNTWSHIAWSRNSGVSRLYLNGALTLTFTDTYNYGNPGTVKIGTNAFYSSSPTAGFNGSMDEIRITKGTGRYPAAFTTPAYPLAQ